MVDYCASIYAHRKSIIDNHYETIDAHAPVFMRNCHSEDEAIERAMRYALQRWPAADGWTLHQAGILAIPPIDKFAIPPIVRRGWQMMQQKGLKVKANKKEVRFGDLKVGDAFFEKPDKRGYGWVVPLEKIEPVEISGTWHNAKAHKVYIGPWEDDEIVLIENRI